MLRDLKVSGSLKKSSFLKKNRSFSHQNTVTTTKNIQYIPYTIYHTSMTGIMV